MGWLLFRNIIINDYVTFPHKSHKSNYLSGKLGSCGRDWCILYIIWNTIKAPCLDCSLMVNKISFSCHIPVSYMSLLFLCKTVQRLLLWINSNLSRVGLCSPYSDLQYRAISCTSTYALQGLLKLETFPKKVFFSNNNILIDLIKTILI